LWERLQPRAFDFLRAITKSSRLKPLPQQRAISKEKGRHRRPFSSCAEASPGARAAPPGTAVAAMLLRPGVSGRAVARAGLAVRAVRRLAARARRALATTAAVLRDRRIEADRHARRVAF